MSNRVATLVVLMLACVGCLGNSGSRLANSFGPDNRIDLTQISSPYTAVGRLDSGCTGTLIGKRLVLTAAHCIYDSSIQKVRPETQYFRGAYADGKSDGDAWIEYAWLGTQTPEENRGQDWAILLLDKPLGESLGQVAISRSEFSTQLPYTIHSIGYSTDRNNGETPSLHQGCYVHAVDGERLLHDCDAATGSSGGPMFSLNQGRMFIEALNVSEYRRGAPNSVKRESFSRDYANVGISTAAFAEIALSLLTTLEQGVAAPAFAGVTLLKNPNQRPLVAVNSPLEPTRPGSRGGAASTALNRCVRSAGELQQRLKNIDFYAQQVNLKATELFRQLSVLNALESTRAAGDMANASSAILNSLKILRENGAPRFNGESMAGDVERVRELLTALGTKIVSLRNHVKYPQLIELGRAVQQNLKLLHREVFCS